jgi:hypothetical protein
MPNEVAWVRQKLIKTENRMEHLSTLDIVSLLRVSYHKIALAGHLPRFKRGFHGIDNSIETLVAMKMSAEASNS